MSNTLRPKTLGQLKASGYTARGVKEEIRGNLVRTLRRGEELFPGIVGYEDTVVPQLVNAVLARHDFILLGLRGQAKTRILRAMVNFLDEAVPVVPGAPLNDDPMEPVSSEARRRVFEEGDDLAIEWLERDARYQEKLATPDVTIADLIGDLDPIKAASLKLAYSDERVIHYGIIPRTNRGIFAINELPDLQPRIQVGLLNILEERDFQIRGFPVRIPLDVQMVFSANPEDYTNRGNIITPLRDRIQSQILTHYPRSIEEGMKITQQEAWLERGDHRVDVPRFLREVIEEVAVQARESEYVDQNSGVSARMTIALAETVVSNAEQRAIKLGSPCAMARVCDLAAAVSAVSGKVELVLEGEQEGPLNVARHLIGRGLKSYFARTFPSAFPKKRRGQQAAEEGLANSEYKEIVEWFAAGHSVEVADDSTDAQFLEALDTVKGLRRVATKHLKPAGDAELAVAMEFALEGLHQHSILTRDRVDGRSVTYRDMFKSMFSSLGGGDEA
ncbi:MAG: sigma 54-interacting transcriptional regulator [Candidatus Eisenbacteria bacterium]|nr:sigma 54-interacting transcriptional regulator [Candidatus Eisenbacteria bacterium]